MGKERNVRVKVGDFQTETEQNCRSYKKKKKVEFLMQRMELAKLEEKRSAEWTWPDEGANT